MVAGLHADLLSTQYLLRCNLKASNQQASPALLVRSKDF
ncbi:hypothetical protein EV13_0388 [Prochlorococcus sp. MIT 0702]|nr:hypothetical protein EV12_0087 [Prochlorococcus sp. MIT 0701]KGG30368.1 hypothetical protein EV13_0388 [Prochlorococcus sp. MIT 0702]